MNRLRKYGRLPFVIAVLHGGPGAPGYMASVARELSAEWGMLEPLQAADSVQGQVEELQAVLVDNADLPVVLVGSSWGAMLGFILSARYPDLVQKLIMVGCPVFEARYATQMLDGEGSPSFLAIAAGYIGAALLVCVGWTASWPPSVQR